VFLAHWLTGSLAHSHRSFALASALVCHCPFWLNAAGQRVALVSDTHIDDGNFAECAVVNLAWSDRPGSISHAGSATHVGGGILKALPSASTSAN